MNNLMAPRWYDEELYAGLVDTSQPLRIVHVCKYFPPERGGIETYARDLAFEQARAGHAVTALAHSRQASSCKMPIPQCEVISCKVLFHAGTYVPVAPGLPFQLHKILSSKPHILHLHAPNPAALWCLLLAGTSHTKLVIHWHADVLFPEHRTPFSPALALWRAMEQRLLARADRIIATSTPYLESSEFLAPWQDKCVVAPLRLAEQHQPVSTDVRHPAVDFLRGSKGTTQRSVLAVGRLAHYKGFDVLLQAVAQTPELRCCIIGEGEEGTKLRNLTRQLQLEDRVLFPGTVEDDVLTACYNACDVFCLPSILRTEAFGIVLLEALRADKWCVASNVPGSGMSTVIQHGKNGWLVKPGDVEELVKALSTTFITNSQKVLPQKKAHTPAPTPPLPEGLPLVVKSKHSDLISTCTNHCRTILRYINTFLPLQKWGEQLFLYPALPHITRQKTYPNGPMLLAGFFSSIHGIGEATRYELLHRQNNGENIVGIDISPAFGICDIPPPPGLCTLDDAPSTGPLLLHCNAPEAGRALRFLGPRLTANRYIIGYWAWELEQPPHTWHLAYPYFDELWTPSTHSARAFVDAPIPVRVKPHPVTCVHDGGHSLEELGFPASCMGKKLFLCMADARSDLMRKNIKGTIQAFALALGNNNSTALLVKLHHTLPTNKEYIAARDIAKTCNNIHFVECSYTSAERNSLLHRCDAVISLHRAEGYGLLLAEALVLGKEVIATAYSGNLEFMTPENSTLVPFTKVPITSKTAIYTQYSNAFWAEPNMQCAVDALRNHTVSHEIVHVR